MSTFAKGVTMGVLVSAGLAAPILATVMYVRSQPSHSTVLFITNAVPPAEQVSRSIEEPVAIEVDTLPREMTARPRHRQLTAETPSAEQARDPSRFELQMPVVERAALVQPHYTQSPSIRSTTVPTPQARPAATQLEY